MLTIPEFENVYDRPPRWIVAAPGRVNVIGEHNDYNDSFVLPMAIEEYRQDAKWPVQASDSLVRYWRTRNKNRKANYLGTESNDVEP